MTKHDCIWIAIRVFGLYLLVQAVIAIPSVISSAYGLYETVSVIHSGSVDADRLEQTLRSGLSSQLVNALARLFIFFGIGVHLVSDGSWLFRILCPPDSGDK